MEIERYHKKLIASLNLISLNFNEQREYFPKFVDVPFEILDTFEKAFMLLPELLELNLITYKAIPDLLRLHNLVNLELRNNDFETLEAEKLCNSREWNKIRELSKEILNFMDEPFGKPDKNFI